MARSGWRRRWRSAGGRDIPAIRRLQPLYNLYDRAEYEAKLEPLCRKEGLGVITYFSLASGFLTGKYRSEKDLAQSARGDRVKDYLNDRGFRILGALDQVAKENKSTPGRSRLGLADGAARHHRADCQRHEPGAVERPDRSREPQAGSRVHGALMGLRRRRRKDRCRRWIRRCAATTPARPGAANGRGRRDVSGRRANVGARVLGGRGSLPGCSGAAEPMCVMRQLRRDQPFKLVQAGAVGRA